MRVLPKLVGHHRTLAVGHRPYMPRLHRSRLAIQRSFVTGCDMQRTYSKHEIEEIVRVERLTLRQRLIPLIREVREIEARLYELDRSDGLIEGMDRKLLV